MRVKLKNVAIHKMTEEERKDNLEYIKKMRRKEEEYNYHLSKNYSINFCYLEDRCFDTYQAFLEEDNQQTRSDMFKALFEIAYGVLYVAKYLPSSIDKKTAAYNYAIDYFERLVTNRFSFRAKNGGDRFPFQQYTRLSIRKYIFKYKPVEIVSSEFEKEVGNVLDSIVYNQGGMEKIEPGVVKANIEREVIKNLYSIYSEDEIRRLAYLYRDLKENKTSQDVIKEKFPDVYDFIWIVFTLSRKKKSLYSEQLLTGFNANSLKEHTDSAIRSSLFLMSIANTELLPKELFLNLDVDSLYRLSEMCGGSTVTIPSKKDLDYLILTVCSIADKLANNEIELDEIINNNRVKHKITACRITTVRDLVNKIMNTPLIDRNTPSSEPLVNTIITSIANIEKLFDVYTDSIKKANIPPSVQVSNMVKINTMISSTLDTLVSMKHNIEQTISEKDF